MKVRLKGGEHVYTVVDEGKEHYICETFASKFIASKADYEPVQEWVDISQHCKYALVDSINNHYALCYGSDIVSSRYHSKYRITPVGDGATKVEVKR